MKWNKTNIKFLLILLGLMLFIFLYYRYSIPPCKARISYANNQLNKGINLDNLFRPVDSTEIQMVKASWEAFEYDSDSFKIRLQYPYLPDRNLKVIAHFFAGNKHYGAVIFPKGHDENKKYPILLWANGLDQSNPVVQINHPVIRNLAKQLDNYIIVIPSFRGQSLHLLERSFCSDGFFGDAFDGATDDALRLLKLTIKEFQGADPKNITVCGQSRGGNVALLMGARDTSIQKVVSIAGPTNFHSKKVYYRYGKQYKYQFLSRTQSMDTIRAKMVKSSPVFFIDNFPNQILLIHGSNDRVVPLWHATTLIDQLQDRENFKSVINENGHDFNEWSFVVDWIRDTEGCQEN